jgi:hypothetical protein
VYALRYPHYLHEHHRRDVRALRRV